MRASGVLLCLGSAAAFGAMAIFGQLAYDEGATVGTLLVARFALAALVLWAVVLTRGRRPRIARRDAALALALGAFGYSLQAGGYFAALQRLDAGLVGLLLYTYPTLVTLAAIALGRARADGRTFATLALTSAGLVLVLAGAGAGTLDALGILLAVGAAVVYTGYILTSEGIAGRLGALTLSALVCTGATASLTTGTLLAGDLHPAAVSLAGYGWLAAIAVVSTVGAVVLFFAGLRQVGPSAAAILSTFEPLVTVALAAAVFGDRLSPVQLLGGALILTGVVALNVRRRARRAVAAHPQPVPA